MPHDILFFSIIYLIGIVPYGIRCYQAYPYYISTREIQYLLKNESRQSQRRIEGKFDIIWSMFLRGIIWPIVIGILIYLLLEIYFTAFED